MNIIYNYVKQDSAKRSKDVHYAEDKGQGRHTCLSTLTMACKSNHVPRDTPRWQALQGPRPEQRTAQEGNLLHSCTRTLPCCILCFIYKCCRDNSHLCWGKLKPSAVFVTCSWLEDNYDIENEQNLSLQLIMQSWPHKRRILVCKSKPREGGTSWLPSPSVRCLLK